MEELPVALAATDKALPLRLAPVDDDRAPDGLSCIGSFLGSKLVARCVVPPDAAAFLLERGLFTEPVRLALAAREEPPGLQCRLFALVEIPGDLLTAEEDEASPWASSVPGTAYDRIVSGEDADAGDSSEPGPEDQKDERQAAVFLGQIVRFEKDRRHPGDLAQETLDVLRTIVQGEVSEVVDKVLEDLLGRGDPG